MSTDLEGRLRALDLQLRGLGSVLVAFSGGTDSAFLLAAAVRSLGADNVAAATAVSASLPASELAAARAFAAGFGVGFISRNAIEAELAAGTVATARVKGLDPARQISVVRASGRAETRVAQAFVGFARERLA